MDALSNKKLSRREHQILHLASHGKTNDEIASELSVGCETVKSHIKSVLKKTSAQNRTHAVAIGLRQGYIK